MPITMKDLLQHTIVPWGHIKQIPHTQGFYLVFDKIETLIYVGKGYGDERVKSHFVPSKPEYFDDACYWFWYQTNGECWANAYEQAIYDYVVQETCQPPSRNKIRPEGCGNPLFAEMINNSARNDWGNFIAGIAVQRFVSKDLCSLLY